MESGSYRLERAMVQKIRDSEENSKIKIAKLDNEIHKETDAITKNLDNQELKMQNLKDSVLKKLEITLTKDETEKFIAECTKDKFEELTSRARNIEDTMEMRFA